MIHAKLDKDGNILIHNRILAIRPEPDTSTASRLIGIFTSRVQLSVAVLDDVKVVVGKLGSLMIVRGWMRHEFLEGRRDDFVADILSVDRILLGAVLDLVHPVVVDVGVVSTARLDQKLLGVVSDPVRVHVSDGRGMRLFVYDSVVVSIDHGIDTQREDVLMVRCQYSGVHDCTEGHLDTLIDRLC